MHYQYQKQATISTKIGVIFCFLLKKVGTQTFCLLTLPNRDKHCLIAGVQSWVSPWKLQERRYNLLLLTLSFHLAGSRSGNSWNSRVSNFPVWSGQAASENVSTLPKFQCPDCGKVYKWKITLSRHMRLECNKEPQFQCPFCPLRFKQKCHMVRHASRLHPESASRNYWC